MRSKGGQTFTPDGPFASMLVDLYDLCALNKKSQEIKVTIQDQAECDKRVVPLS